MKSEENPSDALSRKLDLKESQLVLELCTVINGKFGLFTLDLMATESNVMVGLNGKKLRFFSRFPMPGTEGIDVFAQKRPEGNLYVFLLST